ncbi:hypothetical protein PISMIDRAFT_92792, partial [Pisolithus microcarpus 441]
IHPMFHIGLLYKYEQNDDAVKSDDGDLGDIPEVSWEWLVDETMAHWWINNKVEFLVRWNLSDMTWEPVSNCKELEALDRYLELQGVQDICQLP